MTDSFASALFVTGDGPNDKLVAMMQALVELAQTGEPLPLKVAIYVKPETIARIELPAIVVNVPLAVTVNAVNVRSTPPSGSVLFQFAAGVRLVIEEARILGDVEYLRVGPGMWVCTRTGERALVKRL